MDERLANYALKFEIVQYKDELLSMTKKAIFEEHCLN